MLQRIITVALLAGVGYWYWSGPYQERVNPTPEQKLLENSENMRECIYNKKYAASRTLTGIVNPEEICAEELNLYEYEGQWHSYDDVRENH
jgi:hypothetical protein